MTIALDDITRSPAEFVRRVRAGETVLITDAEQAVAELKPVARTTKRHSAAQRLQNHFYVTARPEEWEGAMDELADGGENLPVLSEEAFEREALYEDRP